MKLLIAMLRQPTCRAVPLMTNGDAAYRIVPICRVRSLSVSKQPNVIRVTAFAPWFCALGNYLNIDRLRT